MDFLYFIAFLVSLKCVENAKILATVFTPAYSHQSAFRPLWKELLKRGHEITLLTTNPMNDPELKHLKEIDLKKSYEVMEKHQASEILSRGLSSGRSYKELLDSYIHSLSKTADWQLGHPQVQNIIQNKSEHFDLIITEQMFPTHLGFVDRFNAPYIGIFSMDAPPRIHEAVGNFLHPVAYPDYILPFTKDLTFVQRIISVVYSFVMDTYVNYLFQSEDYTIRKHFGNNIRPYKEIQKDMSMLFINVNPIFHNIRPVGPNTIQIGGGIHIKENQQLPPDLQNFVDNAKDGVIYFSLGTNVKSSLINNRTRSIILDTFASLPYEVVWKFEEESLPNKPDNVKIMKWIPQQDLFRHPKIVLFITQCGLQSMEESIFYQIPMVGMPFFGDQKSNAKILEEKGFGLVAIWQKFTKEEFKQQILEVITNPIYRNQVKETSELMKDIEMDGLDKAVWWTEYTLRTKGAKHLRNPIVDLPFYKYYLLDVIVFVLLIIITFLVLIVRILKFLTKVVYRKKAKGKKKSK